MLKIPLSSEFVAKKLNKGMKREEILIKYGMRCFDTGGMSQEEIEKKIGKIVKSYDENN